MVTLYARKPGRVPGARLSAWAKRCKLKGAALWYLIFMSA